MTASPVPTRPSFTSPVVDYEPVPVPIPPSGPCPQPSPAALHRRPRRPLRSVPTGARLARDPAPPRAATVFVDTTLRRVLEVADRRRPVTQLRPLLAPALFDAVATMIRGTTPEGPAVLRRVRLRMTSVLDGEGVAAEVFATYSRGRRVRAIAGRVELSGGRWVITALQIG